MRKVEIHFECVVSCLVVKIFLVFGGVAEIDVVMQELVCFTLPNGATFTLSSMGYGEAAAQANVTGLLPWGISFFSAAMGEGLGSFS